MMNIIFGPYLDQLAIVHLNNIVIYLNIMQEYRKNVERVLIFLSEH